MSCLAIHLEHIRGVTEKVARLKKKLQTSGVMAAIV